jgi:hypothetical protein
MQHTMDQALGIRQITRFADRSGSGNLDRHVTHAARWRGVIITKARAVQGACHDGWIMAMQSVT